MSPIPRDKSGLTVITTHAGMDFDGFASCLAARKLYPDAMVVLPSIHKGGVRDLIPPGMLDEFTIVSPEDVDLDLVTTLVLVDTRKAGRIGPLARLLPRTDVAVHIFDHHPDAENDIAGNVCHCLPYGATVTILVELLRANSIHVTAEEATVMCLGIYEDTASFTQSSTTPNDLAAAAWLLKKGANLNMVSSLIIKEFSPLQIKLLNELLESMTKKTVHGVEIALAVISTEEYIADFSFLVHKLARMENLDALFVIARMGQTIYIIGRSRLNEVDAGRILAAFGGSGHRQAASAVVKDSDLHKVSQRVERQLLRNVKPRQKAIDIMSTPVIHTGLETTIAEAGRMLTHYNINALVVAEPGVGKKLRLLGYISRQVVEKALQHDLSDAPVSEYMTTDPATVGPDAELAEIQRTVLDHKQRILPVAEHGMLIGVVTRTDLLNIMAGESLRAARDDKADHEYRSRSRTRRVASIMKERLPAHIMDIIENLGRAADEAGVSAYLVGGFVRDLVIGSKNEDVDVVVEGDGPAFAKRAAGRLGGRVHVHEIFGTAVLTLPDGFKVDVASARFEYYQSPASLPEVEKSSLKLDLYRRDFTINTLVIQINPDRFGALLDFFGAQEDLKKKTIQVLHNLSFVEDPTRIFRAIRFEQRFGFTLGKLTASLITNAVKRGFVERLSGRRIMTELRLILSEETPQNPLRRMHQLGLLRLVHPSLVYDDALDARLSRAKNALAWYELLYLNRPFTKWNVVFCVLLHGLGAREAASACRRMEIPPRLNAIFTEDRLDAKKRLGLLERKKDPLPSELYKALSGLSHEMLVYMMAVTEKEPVRQGVSLYITRLSRTSTLLRGNDLKKMGFPAGPLYGKILDALICARLDGHVETLDDEIALAGKIAGDFPQAARK